MDIVVCANGLVLIVVQDGRSLLKWEEWLCDVPVEATEDGA